MKRKSIKINAFLNFFKVLCTIIFPLITYPYASRVLGIENIGKVQFGASLIVFISLFASLGINVYAIREGSKIRNDKRKVNDLISELFSISIVTTIISYIILFVILFFVPKFNSYKYLIFIQSLSVLLNTLGIDWVLQIYEDYLYITIRSIIFNFLGLLALFLFVKNPNDYYIYSVITLLSGSGAYLINLIYIRKYCRIRFTLNLLIIKKHIKSLLVLFANNLAIQLYVNSDQLMLGLISGNHFVGIYSVSVKIYSIIKSLLNSITIVTIPRLSFLLEKKDNKNYNKLLNNILNINILLIFPALIGLFVLSKEIIILLFGLKFIKSVDSLRFLAIALVFSVLNNFLANAVLIPRKKEKIVLLSTIIAAILNVLLNIIFITKYNEIGTAFTTLISEIIVFLICLVSSKNLFNYNNTFSCLFLAAIECLFIIFIKQNICKFFSNSIIVILLTVVISILLYAIIICIFKKNLFNFIKLLKRKKDK